MFLLFIMGYRHGTEYVKSQCHKFHENFYYKPIKIFSYYEHTRIKISEASAVQSRQFGTWIPTVTRKLVLEMFRFGILAKRLRVLTDDFHDFPPSLLTGEYLKIDYKHFLSHFHCIIN